MAHLYNGIQFSNKKEPNTDTCNNHIKKSQKSVCSTIPFYKVLEEAKKWTVGASVEVGARID